MSALYSVQNKNSTVRVYTINLIHKRYMQICIYKITQLTSGHRWFLNYVDSCIKKCNSASEQQYVCCLSDSVPYSQLSNATAQFLVTVVTNLSIADIQDALMQQFQSVSSALRIGLPITVSNMERYGRYTLGTCKIYSHMK